MDHKKIPNNLKLPKVHALEILTNYEIERPPINISKIVADYNLSIEEIDFPQDINHISGMLDIDNMTIFINKNDADTRKAFTVAHELGHYIMHQDALKHNNEYAIVFRKDVKKDDVEREADEFAANLLTPKFLLDKFIGDFTSPELAKLFGVSPQMMEIRVSKEY